MVVMIVTNILTGRVAAILPNRGSRGPLAVRDSHRLEVGDSHCRERAEHGTARMVVMIVTKILTGRVARILRPWARWED
jgi:hypothetical protein